MEIVALLCMRRVALLDQLAYRPSRVLDYLFHMHLPDISLSQTI